MELSTKQVISLCIKISILYFLKNFIFQIYKYIYDPSHFTDLLTNVQQNKIKGRMFLQVSRMKTKDNFHCPHVFDQSHTCPINIFLRSSL